MFFLSSLLGSETHFKVVCISDVFTGQSLIARHRQINTLLAEEIKNGIHALSIVARTNEQWNDGADGKNISPSPNCLGGSKK